MTEQDFCRKCGQRQSCQNVYEKMSGHKGPSVLWKVVAAFLIPMVVFIAAVAISARVLMGSGVAKGTQTFLSFVIGIVAVFSWVLAIKGLRRRANDS